MLDRVIRVLATWQEIEHGVRGVGDASAYGRVHDRLRAIEQAQRRAAIRGTAGAQRTVVLEGRAGSEASGRFGLRNPSGDAMALSVVALAGALPTRVEHPAEIGPHGEATVRVVVIVPERTPSGTHEIALDVRTGDAFRLRVWLEVRVA